MDVPTRTICNLGMNKIYEKSKKESTITTMIISQIFEDNKNLWRITKT